MKYTHFRIMTLMLSASALLALSGCGSSGVESDQDLLGTTTTPPVVTPPIVTPPVSNTAPVFDTLNTQTVFKTHKIPPYGEGTLQNKGPISVYSIDMDDDGDMDILNGMFDNRIAWFENDGSQNFTEHNISTTTDVSRSIFALDIDDDSDIDVLSVASSDDKVVWFENDGSQNFTEHNISTTTDGPWSISVVDMDGDSDIDVVCAEQVGNHVAWFENDGRQSFTKHIIATPTFTSGSSTLGASPVSVYAVDINSDDNIDVLSAYNGAKTIAWHENDGAESFTEHIISTNANGAQSVFALDLDKDGDIDALSASQNDNKIAWYENDGAENFTEHNISTNVVKAYSVYAIDIDGDGNNDVLSAGFGNSEIAWHHNNGNQTFTKHIITTNAVPAYQVYSADVDGDGDNDVLSASRNGNQVAWYENLSVLAVDENQTAAGTILATDSDGDTLTYSISGGADAAKFTIDQATAALSFITAPLYATPTDSDADNIYEVTVSVTDGTDDASIDVSVSVEPVIP